MMHCNLNHLAKRITTLDGGERQISTAHARECLAALGRHWREVGWWQAFREFLAIRQRAGKR